MSIQVQGYSGVVAEVDGTTFRALRVTLRPVDYGALGQYRISMLSGTMLAGLVANSEIYQVRWTQASNLALIWGVSLDGLSGSATAFAAGFAQTTLTIARGWSADGSGGAIANLIGSNNQKLRTSMGSPLMQRVRVATTTALGAGVKTLDAQPEGQSSFCTSTTPSVVYQSMIGLYGSSSIENGGNPTPIVLANQEGIVVRATIPATGTWQFGITMAWSEVASY